MVAPGIEGDVGAVAFEGEADIGRKTAELKLPVQDACAQPVVPVASAFAEQRLGAVVFADPGLGARLTGD